MTQVQIRFASVIRYVAFAVFIRIKRSRIDIDIGIELLNRYFVATCLEQLAYRGGYNSLSQRGDYPTRYKYVLRFVLFHSAVSLASLAFPLTLFPARYALIHIRKADALRERTLLRGAKITLSRNTTAQICPEYFPPHEMNSYKKKVLLQAEQRNG